MQEGSDIVRLDEKFTGGRLHPETTADPLRFIGKLLLPLPRAHVLDDAIRKYDIEAVVG